MSERSSIVPFGRYLRRSYVSRSHGGGGAAAWRRTPIRNQNGNYLRYHWLIGVKRKLPPPTAAPLGTNQKSRRGARTENITYVRSTYTQKVRKVPYRTTDSYILFVLVGNTTVLYCTEYIRIIIVQYVRTYCRTPYVQLVVTTSERQNESIDWLKEFLKDLWTNIIMYIEDLNSKFQILDSSELWALITFIL